MHYAAHSNKYLLVYPQGALLEGEPHWNPCLPSDDNKSDIDDLGFVEALLDQVSSDYLIDRNKDVKNMEFQNAKEWDEESLAEEQKKFGDIEDKKETLEKSNGSIDNEQIQSVEEPAKGKAVEESGSVSQSVKEDLNASLPDKEDPGYFELLLENIGF